MGSGSGGPLALKAGRKFEQNLSELTELFPLNSSGFFGKKGRGRGRTRNIASDDPVRAAAEFAYRAAYSPVTAKTIAGKGIIWTMRDGTVITYRFYSSSPDRSPVVELNIQNLPGVKSQKIHFVKRGGKYNAQH